MYNDWLSVDEEELLRPVLGMHTFSCAAGENYGDVQWFVLLYDHDPKFTGISQNNGRSVNRIKIPYPFFSQAFYGIPLVFFT